MKRAVLSLLFSLSVMVGMSQPTMLEWAKTLNGSGFIFTADLFLDGVDNAYVCGRFSGTTDFDPSGETENMTAVDGQDGFVAKYNTDGDLQWARQVGGNGDDQITGVTADDDGNVYVCGYFVENGDFDPGEETLTFTSAGSRDFFVLKLDVNGDLVWAVQIGDTSADEANGISTNGNGDIFITGRFTRTVDFDPGPGTAELDNFGSSFPDIFILQLNADGEYQWAEKLGVGDSDVGNAVEATPEGDVVVAGIFNGTVDFDPGPGEAEFFGGGLGDVFITKFSADGDFMWVTTTSGDGFTTCQDLTIDNGGNVYATGWFTGEVDFNAPSGPLSFTSLGAEDAYVTKVSPNGQLQWVRQLAGASLDWSYSIAVDILGDVYSTGFFYDTVDFDPGPGVANVTSQSIEDIFLSKLTTDGNFVWAKRMGGPGSEAGYGIAIGNTGDIFTMGTFFQTADLDPEETTFNVTSAGGADGYLVKIDQDVMSSINEIASQDLLVYPNPGSGEVILQAPMFFNDATIFIRTLEGKVVKTATGQFGENLRIDLTDQWSGYYLIQVIDGKQQWQAKWIKQ